MKNNFQLSSSDKNLFPRFLGFFRGIIHKSNHYSHQTESNQKQCPVDSNIINHHLISLNNSIPNLKNKIENVKPKNPKKSWGTLISEVNNPNTQDPKDNLETSKENLANSSVWRSVKEVLNLSDIDNYFTTNQNN